MFFVIEFVGGGFFQKANVTVNMPQGSSQVMRGRISGNGARLAALAMITPTIRPK